LGPKRINIGETDYCDGEEPESATAGNVAVTTTDEWLFLRGPLVAFTPANSAVRTLRLCDRALVREEWRRTWWCSIPLAWKMESRTKSRTSYSEGFDFVLVNGKTAVDEGRLTDTRGGVIVRGGGASRARHPN
jgi:hypothetical protein